MAFRRVCTAGAVALMLAAPGCNIIKPLGYYLAPPQIQKAEYKFAGDSRIAVLVETARSEQERPVFNRALVSKIVDIFRQKKSQAGFVPYDSLLALQQQSSDWRSWSVQRIGRELGASEVIYIRIDHLQLTERPDEPVYTPRVTLRTRVIDVNQLPPHHRLWPPEEDGRELTCTRPMGETGDATDADQVLTKLAIDTAHRLVIPFFDTDLEEPIPTER